MTAERRGEEVAAVEDRGGGAGGREERAVPDDAAGARARWRALDDRALVLAVRRDDPRALEEYIERYRPLLLRQARRSGLPEGERDDIVLDLLVRTAAQLARGDAAIPRSLGAYLTGALRFRLANAHRDRGRRERVHEEAMEEGGGGGERAVLSACSEASVRAARGPGWQPPAPSPALRRLEAALTAGLREEEMHLLLWDHERIPKQIIAGWIGAGYEATKQRIRRLRARLRDAALRHAATLGDAERREVLRYIGASEDDLARLPPPTRAPRRRTRQ